ncbi:condensation domain-containing protein [Promicromonospora sp. Populi]|uniref:condensation domain-containing protein n=1 Tax=Promicromonospora sp. Populi TaxID=3239420 RepID=UPI0034E22D5A
MILGAMGTWSPSPGQVLHVRPTADALAAAQGAPVDPGPPSFLQGDHLGAYAARRESGGRHRAWTGTASRLEGEFDAAALARALTRLVRRHEGLRTWFDVDGCAAGGTPVRHLVSPDAVDFEVVGVPALSPVPGLPWDEWVTMHLNATFDAACRPDSWAPFALGAVVADDGFSLFWGCDHAFTDGASGVMVLSEIEELYAAELGAGPEPEPRRETARSCLDHARAEHELAAATPADAPEIQAWVDAVAAHDGRMPRFVLDLGLAPGETAPVRIRSATLLDADGLARMDELAAAHRARFTGAVFAALALTDARLTGATNWFGVTVVGSRGPGFETTQGWLCNFTPITFPVADGGVPASFTTVLPRASAAFRQARKVARVPVHAALGVMLADGVLDPASLGSPQLVSYLDLRKFPGVGRPAYDNGLHFTGEGRTANASLWINRDADRLYVVMQTPDTPTAQAATDRYIAELTATFEAALLPVAEPEPAGELLPVGAPAQAGQADGRDEALEATGAGPLG